jgi:hypothetical protein
MATAATLLAAEPAVRAAERAIVARSPIVLTETLAVSTAAECAGGSPAFSTSRT